MKVERNFLEKSVYLRKFCLIYLIKLNQKNKNCQFCLDKIFEKNYKVRHLSNINYIKEDFFKFSSFFQNLLNSFSKIKSDRAILLPKIENEDFMDQLKQKKSKYLFKNFRNSKKKNSSWFQFQKKIFLKETQMKKTYYLFNAQNLLNLVSRELYKKSIIGFSKKSLDFIIEILKKTTKNILNKLGNIAINRKLHGKKTIEEWGVNNIICKKIKTENKVKLGDEFQIKLKKSIRKYKIKKRISNLSKKYKIFDKDIKNDNLIIEKKVKENDDIILRANKTLMTLLDEILKNRVEELKKETSCLGAYKPSEIKILPQIERKTKTNLQKTCLGKKERKKKKSEKRQTHCKNLHKTSNFVNSYSYLSGIDCFLFLKNNKIYNDLQLCTSLFLILISDFNSRLQKYKIWS
jgi:hypothetical protein